MTGNEVPTLTRRTLFRNIAGSTSTAWICTRFANAQGRVINNASEMIATGASATIDIYPLRRDMTVLIGSGCNILVLPGKDGKVLIDSAFGTSQNQIKTALDSISKDPIKHLINTHWHFDHAGGNEWIHSAGATIIAHDNTRGRMSVRQEIPAFHGVFPAYPDGGIPAVIFSDKTVLALNDEDILLDYYGVAHSDSDISVRFAKANVLHTGDTWFNGVYPFIDYYNGGTLGGMITASARNLHSANEETLVVPGHGPVGNKSQLAEYDRMLHLILDRVARLKKQGRLMHEVVAAKPTGDFDAKWGIGLVPPDAFVELVYIGA